MVSHRNINFFKKKVCCLHLPGRKPTILLIMTPIRTPHIRTKKNLELSLRTQTSAHICKATDRKINNEERNRRKSCEGRKEIKFFFFTFPRSMSSKFHIIPLFSNSVCVYVLSCFNQTRNPNSCVPSENLKKNFLNPLITEFICLFLTFSMSLQEYPKSVIISHPLIFHHHSFCICLDVWSS